MLLSIDDGIDALIKIINRRDQQAHQKIFNLGNPNNEYSIKALAEITLEMVKHYPKYQSIAEKTKIIATEAGQYYGAGYQDVDRRVPSIENAKKYLDWSPTTSLQDALKRILDYHLANKLSSAL